MSMIEDKEAIRELFSEYCFRMDDGQYRGVAELFCEDGEWIASYTRAKGREAIGAMFAGMIPDKTSGVLRKHCVLNSLIRIDGDTATARAAYLVFVGEGKGPRPVVAGTYEDELVRTGEGWRFRSRRLVHDIVGELSLNPR